MNTFVFHLHRGICHHSKPGNVGYKQLESLFPVLSKAYYQISMRQNEQNRQYFGLRDFYR